jgi:hypothetical protein
MTNRKSQLIAINYECKTCNYITSNKNDFKKHEMTAKHKIRTNTNENSAKIAKEYICSCSKVFKHASSLWNHKRTCIYEDISNKSLEENEPIKEEEKKDLNVNLEMVMELIKNANNNNNTELKELIINQNKQIIEILETQHC